MRKHLIPVSFETHELVSTYAELAGFIGEKGIHKTSKRVWINQPKRMYKMILKYRKALDISMDSFIKLCLEGYIKLDLN